MSGPANQYDVKAWLNNYDYLVGDLTRKQAEDMIKLSFDSIDQSGIDYLNANQNLFEVKDEDVEIPKSDVKVDIPAAMPQRNQVVGLDDKDAKDVEKKIKPLDLSGTVFDLKGDNIFEVDLLDELSKDLDEEPLIDEQKEVKKQELDDLKTRLHATQVLHRKFIYFDKKDVHPASALSTQDLEWDNEKNKWRMQVNEARPKGYLELSKDEQKFVHQWMKDFQKVDPDVFANFKQLEISSAVTEDQSIFRVDKIAKIDESINRNVESYKEQMIAQGKSRKQANLMGERLKNAMMEVSLAAKQHSGGKKNVKISRNRLPQVIKQFHENAEAYNLFVDEYTTRQWGLKFGVLEKVYRNHILANLDDSAANILSKGGAKASQYGLDVEKNELDTALLQNQTVLDAERFLQGLEDAGNMGIYGRAKEAINSFAQTMGEGRAQKIIDTTPPQYKEVVADLLVRHQEERESRNIKARQLFEEYINFRPSMFEAGVDVKQKNRIKSLERSVMFSGQKMLAIQKAIGRYSQVNMRPFLPIDIIKKINEGEYTEDGNVIKAGYLNSKHPRLGAANTQLEEILENPKGEGQFFDGDNLKVGMERFLKKNKLQESDLPKQIKNLKTYLKTANQRAVEYGQSQNVSEINILVNKLNQLLKEHGHEDLEYKAALQRLNNVFEWENKELEASDLPTLVNLEIPSAENMDPNEPFFVEIDGETVDVMQREDLLDQDPSNYDVAVAARNRDIIKQIAEEVKTGKRVLPDKLEDQNRWQRAAEQQLLYPTTPAKTMSSQDLYPNVGVNFNPISADQIAELGSNHEAFEKIRKYLDAGIVPQINDFYRPLEVTERFAPGGVGTSPREKRQLAENRGDYPVIEDPLMELFQSIGTTDEIMLPDPAAISAEETKRPGTLDQPILTEEKLSEVTSKPLSESLTTESASARFNRVKKELENKNREVEDTFKQLNELKDLFNDPNTTFSERLKLEGQFLEKRKEFEQLQLEQEVLRKQFVVGDKSQIPVLANNILFRLRQNIGYRASIGDEIGRTAEKYNFETLMKENPRRASYPNSHERLFAENAAFREYVRFKNEQSEQIFYAQQEIKSIDNQLERHINYYPNSDVKRSERDKQAVLDDPNFKNVRDALQVRKAYLALLGDVVYDNMMTSQSGEIKSTFPELLFFGGPVSLGGLSRAGSRLIGGASSYALTRVGAQQLVANAPAWAKKLTLTNIVTASTPALGPELLKSGLGLKQIVSRGTKDAVSKIPGTKTVGEGFTRLGQRPFLKQMGSVGRFSKNLVGMPVGAAKKALTRAAFSSPGAVALGLYFTSDPRDTGPDPTGFIEGREFYVRELLKDIGRFGVRGSKSIIDNLLDRDAEKAAALGGFTLEDVLGAPAAGLGTSELIEAVNKVELLNASSITTPDGKFYNMDPSKIKDQMRMSIDANYQLATNSGSIFNAAEQTWAGDIPYLAEMNPDDLSQTKSEESPLTRRTFAEYPATLQEKIRQSVRWTTKSKSFGSDVPDEAWLNYTFWTLPDTLEHGLTVDMIQSDALIKRRAQTTGAGGVMHWLDDAMFAPEFDAENNKVSRKVTWLGYGLGVGAALAPRVLIETVKEPFLDDDRADWGNRILANLMVGDTGMMGEADFLFAKMGFPEGSGPRQAAKYGGIGMDFGFGWEKAVYGPPSRALRTASKGVRGLRAFSGFGASSPKFNSLFDATMAVPPKALTFAQSAALSGIVAETVFGADPIASAATGGLIGTTAMPVARGFRKHRLRKEQKKLQALSDQSGDAFPIDQQIRLSKINEELDALEMDVNMMTPDMYYTQGGMGFAVPMAAYGMFADANKVGVPEAAVGTVIGIPAAIVNKLVSNNVAGKLGDLIPAAGKIFKAVETYSGEAQTIGYSLATGRYSEIIPALRTQEFKNSIRGIFQEPGQHRNKATTRDIYIYKINEYLRKMDQDDLAIEPELTAARLGLEGKVAENFISMTRDRNQRIFNMAQKLGIPKQVLIDNLKNTQAETQHRVALLIEKILLGESRIPKAISRHKRFKQFVKSLDLVDTYKMNLDKEATIAFVVAIAEMLFKDRPQTLFDMLDFDFKTLGKAAEPDKIVVEKTLYQVWDKFIESMPDKQRAMFENYADKLKDNLTGNARRKFLMSGQYTELKNNNMHLMNVPIDKYFAAEFVPTEAAVMTASVSKTIAAQPDALDIGTKEYGDTIYNKPFVDGSYPTVSKRVFPEDKNLPSLIRDQQMELNTAKQQLSEVQNRYDQLDFDGAALKAADELTEAYVRLDEAKKGTSRPKAKKGQEKALSKARNQLRDLEDVRQNYTFKIGLLNTIPEMKTIRKEISAIKKQIVKLEAAKKPNAKRIAELNAELEPLLEQWNAIDWDARKAKIQKRIDAAEKPVVEAKKEQSKADAKKIKLIEDEIETQIRKINELEQRKPNDLFPESRELNTQIVQLKAKIADLERPNTIANRVRDESFLFGKRKEGVKEVRIYDQRQATDKLDQGTFRKDAVIRYSEDTMSAVVDTIAGTWFLGKQDFSLLTDTSLAALDYRWRKLILHRLFQFFAQIGKDRVYLPLGKEGIFYQLYGEGQRLGLNRRKRNVENRIKQLTNRNEKLTQQIDEVKMERDPAKLRDAEKELIAAEKKWADLEWGNQLEKLFDEEAKLRLKGEEVQADIVLERFQKLKNDRDAQIPNDLVKDSALVLKEIEKAKTKYNQLMTGVPAKKLFDERIANNVELHKLKDEIRNIDAKIMLPADMETITKLENALVKALKDYFADVDPTLADYVGSSVRRVDITTSSPVRKDMIKEWWSDAAYDDTDYIVIDFGNKYKENIVFNDGSLRDVHTFEKRFNVLQRREMPLDLPEISFPKDSSGKAKSLKTYTKWLRQDLALREQAAGIKLQLEFPKEGQDPAPLIEALDNIQKDRQAYQLDLIGNDDLNTVFEKRKLTFENDEVAMGYVAMDGDGNPFIIQATPTKATKFNQISSNVLVIEDMAYANKPVGYMKNTPERAYQLQTDFKRADVESKKLRAERAALNKGKISTKGLSGKELALAKVANKSISSKVNKLTEKIDKHQATKKAITSTLISEGYYDVLKSGFVGSAKSKAGLSKIRAARVASESHKATIFADMGGEPMKMVREFLKAVVKDEYSGIAFRSEQDKAFGGALINELRNAGVDLDIRMAQIADEKGTYTFIHFGTFDNQIKGYVENLDPNITRDGTARLIFDNDVADIFDAARLADFDINKMKSLKNEAVALKNWLGGFFEEITITGIAGRNQQVLFEQNFFGLTKSDVASIREDIDTKISSQKRKIATLRRRKAKLDEDETTKPETIEKTNNQINAIQFSLQNLETASTNHAKIEQAFQRQAPAKKQAWYAVPGRFGQQRVEMVTSMFNWMKKIYPKENVVYIDEVPHLKWEAVLEEAKPASNIRNNLNETISGARTLIINGLGTKFEPVSNLYKIGNYFPEADLIIQALVGRIAREAAANGFDAVAVRINENNPSQTIAIQKALNKIGEAWGLEQPQSTYRGEPARVDYVRGELRDLRASDKVKLDEFKKRVENPEDGPKYKNEELFQQLLKEKKNGLTEVELLQTSKYRLLAHEIGVYSIHLNGTKYDAIHTLPITPTMAKSVKSKSTRTRVHFGEYRPRTEADKKSIYIYKEKQEPVSSWDVSSLLIDPDKNKLVVESSIGRYELEITKKPTDVNNAELINELSYLNIHPLEPHNLDIFSGTRLELMDIMDGDVDNVNRALNHIYNEEVIDGYARKLREYGYEVEVRAESGVLGDIRSRTTINLDSQREFQSRTVGQPIQTRVEFEDSRVFEAATAVDRIDVDPSTNNVTFQISGQTNRIDTGLTRLDFESLIDGVGTDSMLIALQDRVLNLESGNVTLESIRRAHQIANAEKSPRVDFDQLLVQENADAIQLLRNAIYLNAPLLKLDGDKVVINQKVAARINPDLVVDVKPLTDAQANQVRKRIRTALQKSFQNVAFKLSDEDLLIIGAHLGLDDLTAKDVQTYIVKNVKNLDIKTFNKRAGIDVSEMPLKNHHAFNKTGLIPALLIQHADLIKRQNEYTPLIEFLNSSYDSGTMNFMRNIGKEYDVPTAAELMLTAVEKDYARNVLSKYRATDSVSLSERNLPTNQESKGYNPRIDIDKEVLAVVDSLNDGVQVTMRPNFGPLEFLQANAEILTQFMPNNAKKHALSMFENDGASLTTEGSNDFVRAFQRYMSEQNQPPSLQYAAMMNEMANFLDKLHLRLVYNQRELKFGPDGKPLMQMEQNAIDRWSGMFKPTQRAAERAYAEVRTNRPVFKNYHVRIRPEDPDATTTVVGAVGKEEKLRPIMTPQEILRDLNQPVFDPLNPILKKSDTDGIHVIAGEIIKDGTSLPAMELFRRLYLIDVMYQFDNSPTFANLRSDNFVPITRRTIVQKDKVKEYQNQAFEFMNNILPDSISTMVKRAMIVNKDIVESWLGIEDQNIPSVRSGIPIRVSEEALKNLVDNAVEASKSKYFAIPKQFTDLEALMADPARQVPDPETGIFTYRVWPVEVAQLKQATTLDPVAIHLLTESEAKKLLRESDTLGQFPMSDTMPEVLALPFSEFAKQRKYQDKYVIYQHELNDVSDVFLDTIAPIGSYRNARLEAAPKSMLESIVRTFSNKLDEQSIRPVKAFAEQLFIFQESYKDLAPRMKEVLQEIDATNKDLSTNLLNDIMEARKSAPDEQKRTLLNLMKYFSNSLVPPVRPELLGSLYNLKGRMQRIGEENVRAKPLEFEEATSEGFLTTLAAIVNSDGKMSLKEKNVIDTLSELGDLKRKGTYTDYDNHKFAKAVYEVQVMVERKLNQVNSLAERLTKAHLSRAAPEFIKNRDSNTIAWINRRIYTQWFEGRWGPSAFQLDKSFEPFIVMKKENRPIDFDFIQRTGREVSPEGVVEFLRDKGFGDFKASQSDILKYINKELRAVNAKRSPDAPSNEVIPPLGTELTEAQKQNILISVNTLLVERGPGGINRFFTLTNMHDLFGAKNLWKQDKGVYRTNPAQIMAEMLVIMAHHDQSVKNAEKIAKTIGAVDMDSLYTKFAVIGANAISTRDKFQLAVLKEVQDHMNMQSVEISTRALGEEQATKIRTQPLPEPVEKSSDPMFMNSSRELELFEPDELQAARYAARQILDQFGLSPRQVGSADDFVTYTMANGKTYVLPEKVKVAISEIEEQTLNIGKHIGMAGPSLHFEIAKQIDGQRMVAERNYALRNFNKEDVKLLSGRFDRVRAKIAKKFAYKKLENIPSDVLAVQLTQMREVRDQLSAGYVLSASDDWKNLLRTSKGEVTISLLAPFVGAALGYYGAAELGFSPIQAGLIGWMSYSALYSVHTSNKDAYLAAGLIDEHQRMKEHIERFGDKIWQNGFGERVIEFSKSLDEAVGVFDDVDALLRERESNAVIEGQKAQEALDRDILEQRVQKYADLRGVENTGPTADAIRQTERRKEFIREYGTFQGMPHLLSVGEMFAKLFNFSNMTNNIKMMMTVGKGTLPYNVAVGHGQMQQAYMSNVATGMNFGAIMGGVAGVMATETLPGQLVGMTLGVPVGQALGRFAKQLPYLRERFGNRTPVGASAFDRPKQVMGMIFATQKFWREGTEKYGFKGKTLNDYMKYRAERTRDQLTGAAQGTLAGLGGVGVLTATSMLFGTASPSLLPTLALAAGAGFLSKTNVPSAAVLSSVIGGVSGNVLSGGGATSSIIGAVAGYTMGTKASKTFASPRKIFMKQPETAYSFPPVVTPDGKVYFAHDIVRQITEYGVGSSFLKAEVGTQFLNDLRTYHDTTVEKIISWMGGERFQQLLIEIAEAQDKYYRYSIYLDLLEEGMRPREAAQKTRDTMFDYGQLTEFERGVMRNAALFYSFMRRNASFMYQTIARRPERYLGWSRLNRDLMDEAFEYVEPEFAVPSFRYGRIFASWFKESFGTNKMSGKAVLPPMGGIYKSSVPILPMFGDVDFLMIGKAFMSFVPEPIADLIGIEEQMKMEDAFRYFFQQANPTAALPLVTMTGKTFFMDMPLTKKMVSLREIQQDAWVASMMGSTNEGGVFFKLAGTDQGPDDGRISVTMYSMEPGDTKTAKAFPFPGTKGPTKLKPSEAKRLTLNNTGNILNGNVFFLPTTEEDALKLYMFRNIVGPGIFGSPRMYPKGPLAGVGLVTQPVATAIAAQTGRSGQLVEKADRADAVDQAMTQLLGKEFSDVFIKSVTGGRGMLDVYKEALEKFPNDTEKQRTYMQIQFYRTSNGELDEDFGGLIYDLYKPSMNVPLSFYTYPLMGYGTMPIRTFEEEQRQQLNSLKYKIPK